MLRIVATLGIVVLIGILNMAQYGGDPPPAGDPTGGGAPPPAGDPTGGGTVGIIGPSTTVGSIIGPSTTVGSIIGPSTTVGSFAGTGITVGSFADPGTTVGSFAGPGTTVGSFTGADGQVYSAASSFGEHGAPEGFTFGNFSATGGVFPGGGAVAGEFPGGGKTEGTFPGGGVPSFADFSFSGTGGPAGPLPQISELGAYGNFGVIGELKEGGAVGNYGLVDKSGNVLDVSGFGKSFGDFFQQDKGAQSALGQVSDLKPGDIAVLGGKYAAEQLGKLDFLGLHTIDPAVVAAMMNEAGGPGGQGGLALSREQYAGAFGAMNPADIKALRTDVVGDAVGHLGSNDFQAIPPDQVLAMLQSTVLNFDPQAVGGLQQNLGQYEGQLDGMLAAMSFGQYKEIDPSAMLGMMEAMNLGGEGFNLGQTALQGNDVASMLAALNQEQLVNFGGEKVLGSIKDLQKGDFKDVDAKGALNIFNAVGSDKALGLQNLGGIVGRFDADAFRQVGNQPTFNIVKALEARDFKALDNAAAFGACTILDHSQLTEVQVTNLIGLFSSVGEGASNLPTEHVGAYLKSFGGEDVATLGQEAAGNLVGAARDADLQVLSAEIKSAYLSTLAADLLGAAGFGAGGAAADTVFNIVPAGAYNGVTLAQVIGATGAPNLFGGILFGGSP